MKNVTKVAGITLAAGGLMAAAPASATIFEYTVGNGDILTIDTEAGTGSWVGDRIDVSFTSDDFGDFTGGELPSLSANLTSITGTRTFDSQGALNPSVDPIHPPMLDTRNGGTRFNLWVNWGDPVVASDYRRVIRSVTEVPAPGMLGLFGLALVALGLGRRRRKVAAA